MTKEDILEKYQDTFNLTTYSWTLLPGVCVKKNSITISGVEEVGKDILFFNRNGKLYKINSIQMSEDLEGTYLQKIIKSVLFNKQNYTINRSFPEENIVFEYLNKGPKGQVSFNTDNLNICTVVNDENIVTDIIPTKEIWMEKILNNVKKLKKSKINSVEIFTSFHGSIGKDIDKILGEIKENLTEDNFNILLANLYILGEEKKWI